MARPGDGSIATRRIALLVADGMETAPMADLYARLTDAGALPRYVGRRLGTIASDAGDGLPVEVTFEAAPSVLWDAVVLPIGEDAADALAMDDHVAEFVMQQWRHNKAMLVPRSAEIVLHASGVDVDFDLDLDDESMEDEGGGMAGEDRSAQSWPDADERSLPDDDEVAPGLLLVPDDELGAATDRFIALVASHRSFDRFNGNAMLPPAPDLDAMDEAMPAETAAE